MEPGFDPLQEETIELSISDLRIDEVNIDKQPVVSSEDEVKTPKERTKLRTNDTAIQTFQSQPKLIDPTILKSKKFTNWLDVIVSEGNLLAKTIQSMEKTLQWIIQSTRQEKRLELSFLHMKEAFNSFLAELQKK